MTKIVNQQQFPLRHKYDSSGIKKMKMSNNVSSIVVLDSLNSNNGIKSQLHDVVLHPRLSSVPDYQFSNCQIMQSVKTGTNMQYIGAYSFYNCQNLSSADFLGNKNKKLMHIGEYAFSKSGLKSVVINLQGTVADSSTNSHCFSDCTALTSVEMTNATYLADHMFDGCTNLREIKLNNRHGYINEYCFANCTMLTSITIPEQIYMIPEHAFDGCTNLLEVKFKEPSVVKRLESCAFARCDKLTSITLPKSIDKLNYIDPTFLSGSNIDRVIFNGIDDDAFSDIKKLPTQLVALMSEMHSDIEVVNRILADVLSNNIPVVLICSNDNNCSQCRHFREQTYGTDEFKTWLKTQDRCYICHAYYNSNQKVWNALTSFMEKNVSKTTRMYSQVGFYWKKEDGTTTKKYFASDEKRGLKAPDRVYKTPQSFIDDIEKTFKDFSKYTEITYEIKDDITTFGRGSGKQVEFVSSSGKSWKCENETILYVPEPKVDKTTTSNFKYGIWYYNLRELKAFADQTNQPLFLEFGAKSCEPCQDFKKNTFCNQEFQKAITSKPVFLCKIELEPGQAFDHPTTTQYYYAAHEVGDPKMVYPQIVYYWKKSDGTTYKEIWNYNHRTDPANANYQTVLSKLDKMLDGFSGGGSSYNPPTIKSELNGLYKYYVQDSYNDLDGTYFPCDSKTDVLSFSDIPLSVLNSSGSMLVYNHISIGDSVDIPNGVYQYFTTVSDSRYSDLSGVIFVVNSSNLITSILTFKNEVSQDYYIEKKNDDVGTWLKFDDTSDEKTFQEKLDNFEKYSNVVIFFEREKLTKVNIKYLKPSTTSQSTKSLSIDLDSARTEAEISALVQAKLSEENNQYTLKSITNLNDIKKIQKFNTEVKYSTALTTWAKQKGYGLVDVAANAWNSGVPKKMRDFETKTKFDGNSTSAKLPKILVYHGCSTCALELVVYLKKKIDVDYSKDFNYYKNLIESIAV